MPKLLRLLPLYCLACPLVLTQSVYASLTIARETHAAHEPHSASDLDDLKKDLRATGDWWESKRQGAVKKLAALNTPEAWALIIEALEQESSQVADEAELQLAGLADKKLIAGLLGAKGLEAKDEWVRLRVAEAFGRMSAEVDAEQLAREARSARAPELRRMLLWTIERRAAAGNIGEAERAKVAPVLGSMCEKDGVAQVRAAALAALVALESKAAAARVLTGASDREPAVRCVALAQFEALEEGQALVQLVRAGRDASLAVRVQALESLVRLGTRSAAIALADRYEQELVPSLRWRLLRTLQEMSGIERSYDATGWKNWAERLPGTWRAQPGVRKPHAAASEEGTVAPGAKLISLPIVSTRIAILIDLSGSVWDTVSGGKTRKQIIDEELKQMLEALPPETEFNLIPYTGVPFPWMESLVPATPQNVKRALDFFVKCKERGRGNFWDAALLAMQDPGVDTLLTLTDGVPTGGHRWNLELMGELLAEQNRFRKLRFDSILVDAPKSRQRDWQEMAERSGGVSIAVDMKGEVEGKAGK